MQGLLASEPGALLRGCPVWVGVWGLKSQGHTSEAALISPPAPCRSRAQTEDAQPREACCGHASGDAQQRSAHAPLRRVESGCLAQEDRGDQQQQQRRSGRGPPPAQAPPQDDDDDGEIDEDDLVASTAGLEADGAGGSAGDPDAARRWAQVLHDAAGMHGCCAVL